MASNDFIAFEQTDMKFLVEINSDGFDMDVDDWAVGVQIGTRIVKKFPKEECLKGEDGNWYVCIDKEYLKKGELSLIAYAQVPDPDFDDGVRDEAYKEYMGRVQKL